MKTPNRNEAAEILALEGLAYIVNLPAEIALFVEASGIDPQSLRERAGEAGVLAAVLDFLLADDKRLLEFCDTRDIEPKDVHVARRVLGGSD